MKLPPQRKINRVVEGVLADLSSFLADLQAGKHGVPELEHSVRYKTLISGLGSLRGVCVLKNGCFRTAL